MAIYLKEILPALINPEKSWKTDLLYRWNEIIGPLHNKVRIEKIYDDTLILGVFHSCWMQELYLLSPLLIKTINEKLDQPYIKEIRFKHVGVKKLKKKGTTSTISKQKKEVELSKEDEYALAQIADPVLREALKAFRIRCHEEK
jgi:Dna[CI] antecedent, DciA